MGTNIITIKVTEENLLKYFGVKTTNDLNGSVIAPLIIKGAVIATEDEAFTVKDIKILSTSKPNNGIQFIGQSCCTNAYIFDRPNVDITIFIKDE